jgi:predicted TIM-barrel fold metal-dependent hydrolase
MYEIFDSHAHIYPEKIARKAAESIGKFYDIKMDCDGSVAKLLEIGKAAGVSRFLVHSVATATHQVSSINRFIFGECAKHKEFIGFMTLHPELTEEQISDEVELCIKNGFRGVKLHPDFQRFAINGKNARKIYSVVDGRLPILLHTGDIRYNYSSPAFLAEVSKDFPYTRFIGAHFGGYSCWNEAAQYYKGCENVWFDTSSSLAFLDAATASKLIKFLGADKFFFGTDYPMWLPEQEIARFLSLDLTEKERVAIFAGNLKKFLNLD